VAEALYPHSKYTTEETQHFLVFAPSTPHQPGCAAGMTGAQLHGSRVSGSHAAGPGTLLLTSETAFLFAILIMPKPNRLPVTKEVCDF